MKVEYSEICNPILSKVTRNNVKGVRKTFLELGDETFEMKEIESEKYKTVIRKIIGHESNKRRCKKEVAYLINIKNKNNTSKASPIWVSNYIKTQSPSIKRRALSPQADKTFVAIKNNTSFLNDKSLEQSTRFKLKLMKAWVCESIHSYKTLVDIKNIWDFPKSDTKNGNNKALTSMMKKYTYRFLKSPNDTSNTETIFQSSQNNSRLKFISLIPKMKDYFKFKKSEMI